MNNRDRKEGGASKLLVVIVSMLLALCALGGGLFALVMFMPSFTVDPYYKYVERGTAGELSLIYGDVPLAERYYALAFEDDTLIDMEFLIDYEVDSHIFWDSAESVLTVSTPQTLIRMRPEEAFYTLNGERTEFPVGNTAVYVKGDGKVFLPVSFVNEFYQVECTVADNGTSLIVDNLLDERTTAQIRKNNAAVRHQPDIKSDIGEKVAKGAEVFLFGGESDGFYRVRTKSGTLGYIKSGDVSEAVTTAAETLKENAVNPPERLKNGFTLVWEQISGDGGSTWIKSKNGAIDVVSPTWFSLADSDGGIKDKGSVEYVKSAVGAGYEVWAMLDNSFDADITHEALKSTAARQAIIDNTFDLIDKYGISGINLDFESYRIEDGYYYTQFIREFCVQMRERGIVTSVDLPVPTLQNSPTDREQIGKYIDYVMVMAYDQHWASSQVKGPVAGHDWVLEGINRTLEYVPASKVVLGLPLYTRIWYEPIGTNSVSTRDFAMQRALDLFTLRNAEMIWEDNTKYFRGQYEYDVDGVKNTITSWLETNETVMHKAQIAADLSLAGVACWKKGLEAEGFWEMLANTVDW